MRLFIEDEKTGEQHEVFNVAEFASVFGLPFDPTTKGSWVAGCILGAVLKMKGPDYVNRLGKDDD